MSASSTVRAAALASGAVAVAGAGAPAVAPEVALPPRPAPPGGGDSNDVCPGACGAPLVPLRLQAEAPVRTSPTTMVSVRMEIPRKVPRGRAAPVPASNRPERRAAVRCAAPKSAEHPRISEVVHILHIHFTGARGRAPPRYPQRIPTLSTAPSTSGHQGSALPCALR